MPLALGEHAHLLRESERAREVAEAKDPLEPLNTVARHYFPIRDRRLELGDFRLAYGGRIATAGDALLLRERGHDGLPP